MSSAATTQAPARALMRAPLLPLMVVYLVFVMVHVVFVAPRISPLLYPDELGFWSHARVMAGWSPPSDPALLRVYSNYYPAYSLLLLPCVLLAQGPLVAYKCALFINCLLLSAVPVLLFYLGRALAPAWPRWLLLGVACAVGLYPTYLLYAGVTLAEPLVTPLLLGLLLWAHRALAKPTFYAWLGVGLGGAALFMVHRRLLVVPLAILLCAALWRGGRRFTPLLGAVIGVTIVLPLANGIVNWISFPEGVGVGHVQASRAITTYAHQGREASNLWNALVALSGHLFYLTSATYGLFVLGMVRAAVGVRRVLRAERGEPREGLAALCGLVLLWALPVHAFYLRNIDSLDFLLHGRYNEAALAPVLLLGVLWIAEFAQSRRGAWTSLVLVAVVAASSLGWLYAFAEPGFLFLANEPVENIGLYPFLTGALGTYSLLFVLGVALVVCAAVVWLWRTGRPAAQLCALGLVSLSFLIVAIDGHRGYFEPGSLLRDRQRALVPFFHLYARARDNPTVGMDRMLFSTWGRAWHVHNYDFFVDCDYRIMLVDGSLPTGEVLVTRRPDVGRFYPAARLAGLETDAGVFVWVLTKAMQDELASHWPLLPSDAAVRMMYADSGKELRLLRFNTEGVYADNGWTAGDGIVRYVNYDVAPEDRYLELRTYGMRLSHGPVPVSVYVDGVALAFSHVLGTSYFYRLPEQLERIDEIRIVSSTFVPAEHGSDDPRRLGIDVEAIVFVAEQQIDP